MPPRRPHQKSRGGCVHCKKKRIKCDEGKPACRHCVRYQSDCIYLHPASNSTTPAQTPGSSSASDTPKKPEFALPVYSPSTPKLRNWESDVKDLELLHFYTTSTSLTISFHPKKQRIWQHIVPQIAFKHEFLLHGILAFSALHLSRIQPHRKETLCAHASMHHNTALASFRLAISNATPENCDACLTFALFTALYGWASSDGKGDLFFTNAVDSQGEESNVEWVQLLRGIRPIVKGSYEWVKHGPLGGLLSLSDHDVKPAPELGPEDAARFKNLETLWAPSQAYNAAEIESFEESLRILKDTYSLMTNPDVDVDIATTVLSWPIRLPEIYIQMVNKRHPEALIILAHYCLLLNQIENCWWMSGMSRHLLQTIHRTIGSERESWIAWPLQDLVLSEFKNKSTKEEIEYGLPPPYNHLGSLPLSDDAF